MPTKSILKNVKIQDTHSCSALAKALESSRECPENNVVFKRTPVRIEKKQIKEFFKKT